MPRGSQSARDLGAVTERARRGDDRVGQPQRARASTARSTAVGRRRGLHGVIARLTPRAAAGRRVVLLQRAHLGRRAAASSAIPAAAASAAATVVTHATPWTIAARRMCMPSARGPRPRGVLTTRSTLPEEMRSTASTPTCSPTLATTVSTGDARLSRAVARCRRSPRSRSRARRSGGRRRGPLSLSRSASERNTVPWRGSVLPAPAWLFANAMPNVRSMPMTSPVERISGPRIVSTSGKRLNGQHRFLHRDVAALGGRVQQALRRASSSKRRADHRPAPRPWRAERRSPC